MPQHQFPNAARLRRRFGAQALADFVAPSIGPVLARQGFGEADVLLNWPEIVGAALAPRCHPVKLQWRGRGAPGDTQGGNAPATLVVRVEGAFALSLQHMAPTIVERVNMHLGWACVGKLALRQGPLPVVPPQRRAGTAADPSATRRAAQSAEGVADEALRAALTRLGSRVLSAAPHAPEADREKSW